MGKEHFHWSLEAPHPILVGLGSGPDHVICFGQGSEANMSQAEAEKVLVSWSLPLLLPWGPLAASELAHQQPPGGSETKRNVAADLPAEAWDLCVGPTLPTQV